MAVKLDYEPADLAILAEPLPLMHTDHKALTAPNRIVYQPMEGNDADPVGAPSPVTMARYMERANGSAGIDFVEALSVSASGRARPQQLMITEATKAGIAKVVAAYRAINEESPLLFQLTHSGRFAIDATLTSQGGAATATGVLTVQD